MEAEGGRVVRGELHALVGRQFAPTVDGFAEQGAELGAVGGRLATDGQFGIPGDGGAQVIAMRGEFGDIGLGGLDVVLVEGDRGLARPAGVAGQEGRFGGGAAPYRRGGLDAAAVSEIGRDQTGDEKRSEHDESEVEAEILPESVHVLRGPCPSG